MQSAYLKRWTLDVELSVFSGLCGPPLFSTVYIFLWKFLVAFSFYLTIRIRARNFCCLIEIASSYCNRSSDWALGEE